MSDTRWQRQKRLERWTGRSSADLDAEEFERAKTAGYEPGADGYMTGRDPRRVSPDELRSWVTSACRRLTLRAANASIVAPTARTRCVCVWRSPARPGRSAWARARGVPGPQRSGSRQCGKADDASPAKSILAPGESDKTRASDEEEVKEVVE